MESSITYSECVFVTLAIQHAMRMLLHCHLWSVWLFHNGMIFGGKKCKFSLQSSSEIFLILRKIQRVTIINVCTSSCKELVILLRF